MLMRCFGGPYDGHIFDVPSGPPFVKAQWQHSPGQYVEFTYQVEKFGFSWGGSLEKTVAYSCALIYNETARNEALVITWVVEQIYKFLGVI